MADFTETDWIDDDGSLVVGTRFSASQMNRIEAGVKDAAQDSKQRGPLASRPAASGATKNWLWIDDSTGALSYCDGSTWSDVGAPFSDGVTRRAAVRSVCFATPNIASPVSATIGGVSLSVGNRTLLVNGDGTPGTQGVYVFNGTGTPMTRPADFASPSDYVQGMTIPVLNGASAVTRIFRYTGPTNPTFGTSAMTFMHDDIDGSQSLQRWEVVHESLAIFTSSDVSAGTWVPWADGTLSKASGTAVAGRAVAPDVFVNSRMFEITQQGKEREYELGIDVMCNATAWPGTITVQPRVFAVSAFTGTAGVLGLTLGSAVNLSADEPVVSLPGSGLRTYSTGNNFSQENNTHMILGMVIGGSGSAPSGGVLAIRMALFGHYIDNNNN